MATPRTINDIQRLIWQCKRLGLPVGKASFDALPESVLDKVKVENSTPVENSTLVEIKLSDKFNLKHEKLSREYGTSLKQYRPIDASYGHEMRNATGLEPPKKTGPRSKQKTPLGEARMILLNNEHMPDHEKRVAVMPEKRLTCRM